MEAVTLLEDGFWVRVHLLKTFSTIPFPCLSISLPLRFWGAIIRASVLLCQRHSRVLSARKSSLFIHPDQKHTLGVHTVSTQESVRASSDRLSYLTFWVSVSTLVKSGYYQYPPQGINTRVKFKEMMLRKFFYLSPGEHLHLLLSLPYRKHGLGVCTSVRHTDVLEKF